MEQATDDDDRALVAAVLAQEPAAFERLVARHQGLCWHIIYRLVRHPEDARDLCQECFLRVHRYLSGYRNECSLKTWIGQVAYSTAVRYLQRKRIPLLHLDEETEDGDDALAIASEGTDMEADCVTADSLRQLSAAIEALPRLQRTLLTLYHLDELSISEVAAITGLAEGTIKSHLCRTRMRLRKTLEQRMGEES